MAIGGGLHYAMPKIVGGIAGNADIMGALGRGGAAIDFANRNMNTAEGRAFLYGSGAFLGGTFIGGYRNKRRGFNKNRGNRI
jgi:hypothetical protein